MKPIHIYVAAGLIVLGVFVAPFVQSKYEEVYPPGRLGEIYDKCEREMLTFDRWNEGARALCLVVNAR